MSHYPRDLIGYANNPPDPKWPNKARLAVNFVINYEEGSEYSIPDGDGFSEASLTESPSSTIPHGTRDLAAETLFEYGARVGFWRLLRLFKERGFPVTLFACALALERNPKVVEAVKTSNLDICCHGWRWIEHYKLTEDEEREQICLAIKSLTKMFGERPLGWYCRTGPSVNTRRLLVEEGGFLYDSDAYNDELPYWQTVDGKPHLVVPYSLTTNDSKFGRGWFSTGEDFFQFTKDAFDMLYEEGAYAPKMMSIGLHQRLIGHPARAMGLKRLLDYIGGFEDIWVCNRLDIAKHWIKTHPFS
ncbi:MAG: chitin deacetylase [Candidatus Endolissoclinum sp. TMED55]|nr:MAG: chitin deacetylase [Candidatus Endolissoclinum sp. TMED55]